MEFIIGVKELHTQYIKIEADDHIQAVAKVQEGEGEELTLEYGHTLDEDDWSVNEVKEDEEKEDQEQKKEDEKEQLRRDEKNGLYPGKEDIAN